MTADPAMLPYEYATRALPDSLELCVRRGPDQLAYCPRCGYEGDGVRYVRADASTSAGTPA